MVCLFRALVHISIHAPREGGDYCYCDEIHVMFQFQSTPPARGATLQDELDKEGKLFQSTPPARGATS